jgi:hypothetical protein
MHLDDSLTDRRICINRGRGSAPGKTAMEAQIKKTFRRLIQKEEVWDKQQ